MSTLLKILEHNHTEKQTPLDGAEDLNTQEDANETSGGGCTAWAVPKPGGKGGSSPVCGDCFLCFNQTQMLKKE